MSDITKKYRQSGMFGSAFRDGKLLADVVEVATPVQIARITVPGVGSADESYKKGRITREGTLSIHKIDTTWELEVFALLSASDDDVRRARDAGKPINPAFSIILKADDPEALGVERWQLDGCRLWTLPLGFNQADDITQKQFDLTWESEKPLTAYKRGVDSQGNDRAVYVVGSP